jgi:hypothetical protein
MNVLGHSIVTIQEQRIGILSPIENISGNYAFIIDSTCCVIKKFYFHLILMSTTSVKFVNSLDRQLKINVDPILYRPSVKTNFPTQFIS